MSFSVLLVAVNCSASVKKCSTSEQQAHSHSDTVINTGVLRRWPAVGSKLPYCWTEKTEIRTLTVVLWFVAPRLELILRKPVSS
jgi:hypothetical protein